MEKDEKRSRRHWGGEGLPESERFEPRLDLSGVVTLGLSTAPYFPSEE